MSPILAKQHQLMRANFAAASPALCSPQLIRAHRKLKCVRQKHRIPLSFWRTYGAYYTLELATANPDKALAVSMAQEGVRMGLRVGSNQYAVT